MSTIYAIALQPVNAHVRASIRIVGAPGTLFELDPAQAGAQAGNAAKDIEAIIASGTLQRLSPAQWTALQAVAAEARAEADAARAAAEAEALAEAERIEREAAEAELLSELVRDLYGSAG